MTDNPTHANVYSALAAAQSEMEAPRKDVANEFFKSRYADLAEVCRVAVPALSRHGLAWYSRYDPAGDGCMVSVIAHGASGSAIECPVPLIVNKRDMQALGSAMTYARRYGLLSLTGLAPEDDDGNIAAKNPPKPAAKPAPVVDAEADVRAAEAALDDKAAKAKAFGAKLCGDIAKAEGPMDAMQVIADNLALVDRLAAYPAVIANVKAALADHGVSLTFREGSAHVEQVDFPDDNLPGVKSGAAHMSAG